MRGQSSPEWNSPLANLVPLQDSILAYRYRYWPLKASGILVEAVLRRLHGCHLTCVLTAGWYRYQLEMRSHQWVFAEGWGKPQSHKPLLLISHDWYEVPLGLPPLGQVHRGGNGRGCCCGTISRRTFNSRFAPISLNVESVPCRLFYPSFFFSSNCFCFYFYLFFFLFFMRCVCCHFSLWPFQLSELPKLLSSLAGSP